MQSYNGGQDKSCPTKKNGAIRKSRPTFNQHELAVSFSVSPHLCVSAFSESVFIGVHPWLFHRYRTPGRFLFRMMRFIGGHPLPGAAERLRFRRRRAEFAPASQIFILRLTVFFYFRIT
jgi:hypothetical protein